MQVVLVSSMTVRITITSSHLIWVHHVISLPQLNTPLKTQEYVLKLRFRQTKSWGINKWKIFIKTSNIHPQISLIFPSTIFVDNCLKMKWLIDLCTVLCMHRFADLNIGYSVELTFLQGRLGHFLKVKVEVDSTQLRICFSSLLDFKTFTTKNSPSLPSKKVNSSQSSMFWSAREYMHMQTCAFSLKFCIIRTVHISINNI